MKNKHTENIKEQKQQEGRFVTEYLREQDLHESRKYRRKVDQRIKYKF